MQELTDLLRARQALEDWEKENSKAHAAEVLLQCQRAFALLSPLSAGALARCLVMEQLQMHRAGSTLVVYWALRPESLAAVSLPKAGWRVQQPSVRTHGGEVGVHVYVPSPGEDLRLEVILGGSHIQAPLDRLSRREQIMAMVRIWATEFYPMAAELTDVISAPVSQALQMWIKQTVEVYRKDGVNLLREEIRSTESLVFVDDQKEWL